MIVTVGDAPRQARGHIGDSCDKWKHFLSDVSEVADQTGTVRGRIERVEMSLKPGFHMIVTVIVSICRRLIGDTSPMCRSRSPTVTIIWKPGLSLKHQLNEYGGPQCLEYTITLLKIMFDFLFDSIQNVEFNRNISTSKIKSH